MGEHARTSVNAYKKGFPELDKPGQGKWLQDDYVKFIRFAQTKMEAEGVEHGIVGVITNHSWIDNPTFRGMRLSLMQTFDQIYVLDLHGNKKKKESAPDGGKDENVFDIEQGVAVALFVKKVGVEKGVWRADLWGEREAKYEGTARLSKSTVDWVKLEPALPQYLFLGRDEAVARHYEAFWSIPSIFALTGDPAPGIVTTHDQFAISYDATEAAEKVAFLLATRDENEARARFRLCTQDQWSYEKAKLELSELNIKLLTRKVLYRPFDTRITVWSNHVAVHRRERIMQHMLTGDNIALITSRMTKGEIFKHAQVSDKISEVICMSPKTSNNGFVFPLYLFSDHGRTESLSLKFRAYLAERYNHNFTAEEILGYIYAVLHAPTYRTRYADFLRTDFPRIPFPDAVPQFEALSRLGWQLVQAHLLREVPHAGLAVIMAKGDHTVEKPRYSPLDRLSTSTPRNTSRPSRRTCGTSTSAAIRSSRNI